MAPEVPESFTLDAFSRAMVAAFREAMEPAPLPKPELVTVGETSDPKLDQLVFCPNCLGERGSRWQDHTIYFWAYDPAHPDKPKRMSVTHEHPEAKKTISYDARAVREGLDKGTHGKQCIACGSRLQVLAA
jgi:hypothetical protein